MISTQTLRRVALLWQVSSGTAPPATGSPGEIPAWRYIKDSRDTDMAEARSAGYTKTALGGELFPGPAASVFIEGDFKGIPPGTYSADIYLDFYYTDPAPADEDDGEISVETEIGPLGGKITLPDNFFIYIPEGALASNTLVRVVKTTETFTDHPSMAGSEPPLSVYRLEPEGIKFGRPAEYGFYVSDLTDYSTGLSAQSGLLYKVFYRDKMFNEWELKGGRTEVVGGKVYVTGSLSAGGLRALYGVTALSEDDFRPRKRIITPDGDGINDELVFQGLSGSEVTVRIFDITGRTVRTISQDPYIWDGKDSFGNTVESGIYIYQFRVEIDGENRLVSGLAAVAK